MPEITELLLFKESFSGEMIIDGLFFYNESEYQSTF